MEMSALVTRHAIVLFASVAAAGVLAHCGETAPRPLGGAAGAPPAAVASASADSVAFDVPVVRGVDAVAAERGRAQLTAGSLAGAWVPALAIENLWVVWGDIAPPPASVYWARFRARYGLVEAPFDNGKYPLGLRASGASVGFDCLLCHADRVAGETQLGVGNSRLDLEGLYDDLRRLNEVAPRYGYPSYPVPFGFANRTGAAGANDAMGLGLTLAAKAVGAQGAVHETCGYQQAPAWWSMRYRRKHYLDGSGAEGNHRTMLATLLASAPSLDAIRAQEDAFRDVYPFILSLDPPVWSLTTLDEARRRRGRDVFDATCATCHGVHSGPEASYPNRVVPFVEVGTDPVRAANFDARDAAFVNASWFGEGGPMTATGGYLAPPLRGVWATAPYFHNGSVPDLAGVIDSRKRPARWKRTGTEQADYDPARVGWRYEEIATPPAGRGIESRKVFDTAREGLGNGGHLYGDALDEDARSDLLEYLRGL